MFISRGMTKKNEEVTGSVLDERERQINLQEKRREKSGSVGPFFVSRIVGWFLFGSIILTVTIVWCLSTGLQHGKSLMAMGLLLCALGFGRGLQMLYVARGEKWFSLLMTCKDIYYTKAHENVGEYINPTSQTAFKQTQRVTFEMEDGVVITFTFDRMRKFMVNAKYDFYFALPRDGGNVTIDMLQELKIDHSIHPEKIEVDTRNMDS